MNNNLLPLPEELVCPFCGDDGFDKVGLKYHLKYHCKEYLDTDNPETKKHAKNIHKKSS